MIFLIGGNGFVGSAYARLLAHRGLPYRVITRANAEEFRGQRCELLINANGNSKKFLADREPLNEFDESVRTVAQTIEWYKPELYVHLSTGDVYPDQSSPAVTGEDQVIDPTRQSRYGLHKRLAEQLVQGTQNRWLIFRMGGFVGPHLKKNAIYDLLAGAPVWLSAESRLQFITTDHAAEIVLKIASTAQNNEIVNLGAQGVVHLGQLHRQIGSASPFKPEGRTVVFELSTDKLGRLYGGPLPHSTDEVTEFASCSQAATASLGT